MSDDGTRLFKEIERIVKSPYPVSLKCFHTCLRDEGLSGLRKYFDIYPDDLGTFAAEITGALSSWPYVLDVVARIGTIKAMRDALLQAEPLLLNELLERCLKIQDSVPHISAACVSLLSFPLPQSMPLPSSTQAFFSRLFEASVQDPCVSTIEAVYYVLYGACEELVDILPRNSIKKLCDQLKEMMKGAKNVGDQPLNLYCLAIIARLNQGSGDLGDCYHGDRLAKVLQVVALQVVNSCRPDESLPADIAIKHIQLARHIVAAINKTSRLAWSATNRMIVRKLQEKTLQDGLPALVQFQALIFLSSMVDVGALPETAIIVLQELILSSTQWACMRTDTKGGLQEVVSIFETRLQDLFWKNLLCQLLERCLEQQQSVPALCGDVSYMTSEVNRCRDDSAHVSSQLFHATTSAATLESIEKCLKLQPSSQDSATSVLRRDMHLDVLSLLIDCLLGKSQSLNHVVRDLLTRLLGQFRKIASAYPPLERTRSRCSRPSLWDECGTLHSNNIGLNLDWKQRLASELDHDSINRQKFVESLIGRVCQNYEMRCENIEKPLHEEQIRHEETRNTCEALRRHVRQLEHQVHKKSTDCADAQNECMKFMQALETSTAQHEVLLRRIDDLEAQMRVSQDEARQILAETRSTFEKQKLDLDITIACQAEDRLVKIDRMSDLQEHLDSVERALQTQRAASRTEQTESSTRLEELRFVLVQKQIDIDAAQQERQRLAAVNDTLNETCTRLRTSMTESEAEIVKLEAETSQRRQISERELATLSSSHSNQIEVLKSAALEQMEAHAKEIFSKDAAFEEQGNGYKRMLVNRNTTLHSLQKKHERTQQELVRKQEELNEAQTMKARLLGALGLPLPGPDLNTSKGSPPDYTKGARRRKQRRSTAIELETQMSPNSSDSEVLMERSPRSMESQHLSPLPKCAKQKQRLKNWILEDPMPEADFHRAALPADRSSTWSSKKDVPPRIVDQDPVPVMAGILQLESKKKTRATANVWGGKTPILQVLEDASPIPTAKPDFSSGRPDEKENAGYVISRGKDDRSFADAEIVELEGMTAHNQTQ